MALFRCFPSIGLRRALLVSDPHDRVASTKRVGHALVRARIRHPPGSVYDEAILVSPRRQEQITQPPAAAACWRHGRPRRIPPIESPRNAHRFCVRIRILQVNAPRASANNFSSVRVPLSFPDCRYRLFLHPLSHLSSALATHRHEPARSSAPRAARTRAGVGSALDFPNVPSQRLNWPRTNVAAAHRLFIRYDALALLISSSSRTKAT